MKKLFFTLLCLSLIGNSFSQNIKFKKGKVFIDKVVIYDFNQNILQNICNIYFIDPVSKEYLISQEYNDDGTVQITFYKEKVTFETKQGILSKNDFIKDLLRNKVINKLGEVSRSDLEFYVEKNKSNTIIIR